jgi:putative ABC transport system substrate-binding protein
VPFLVAMAAVLAACLVAAPVASEAQPAPRLPRIGVIGERSDTDPLLMAFRLGLRELGYAEGQSILIQYRYARGALDRVPGLAADLVRNGAEILVVGGTVSAQRAKAAAPAVPIVFTLAGDPVGSGLVSSLARPGGNATGLSNFLPEITAKQLEMLKTAAPQLVRVAILYNPTNPVHAGAALEEARETARALGLELQTVEVRQRSEFARAFATLTAWRANAVLALSDPVMGNELAQISKLAAQHRLPAMYSRREFAEVGGLLTYGPSFSDNYRRAASYVDKILKGAKPGDLPVERPTLFDLAVNLKTARTLGLTMPESLVQRADEVIR